MSHTHAIYKQTHTPAASPQPSLPLPCWLFALNQLEPLNLSIRLGKTVCLLQGGQSSVRDVADICCNPQHTHRVLYVSSEGVKEFNPSLIEHVTIEHVTNHGVCVSQVQFILPA